MIYPFLPNKVNKLVNSTRTPNDKKQDMFFYSVIVPREQRKFIGALKEKGGRSFRRNLLQKSGNRYLSTTGGVRYHANVLLYFMSVSEIQK